MHRQRFLYPLTALLISILGCSLPGTIHPPVQPTLPVVEPAASATSTIEAILPTSTSTLTPEPTISPATATVGVQYGNISGRVNYPSEFIPAQRVVIYQADDFKKYFTIDTVLNQSEFSIQVPEGKYFAVSYVTDGTLSAGYTAAVPCGLSVGCEDHSLIPFMVTAGETVKNIDIFDWYAPEGNFPPMP